MRAGPCRDLCPKSLNGRNLISTLATPFRWVSPRGARDPIPDPHGLAPGQLSTAFTNLRAISLDKFLPIDQKYNYTAQVQSLYKWMRVEHLLSQVSTLLDRCLAARSEFRDASAKSFTTWLELAEFDALDAIHKDEIQAGYYTLDAARSAAAVNAIHTNWNLLQTASRLLERTIGYIGNHISDQVQRSIMVGDRVEQDFEIGTRVTDGINQENSEQLQATYDAKAIDFRRRRTQAARDANAMKLIAYTSPNGALNYNEQLSGIRQRFLSDADGVLQRLGPLRDGLARIYSYSLPPALGDLDSIVVAIREVIGWMAEFSVDEQNYILPLSVRTLAGNTWNGGLSDSGCSFNLDLTIFAGRSFIRLRGISLSVITDDSDSTWSATITPPAHGLVRFAPNGPTSVIDQSDIAPVTIGRVRPLSSPQPPDVAGALSLTNASPAGATSADKWNVVIRNVQGGTSIDDALLYLVLAVRQNPKLPGVHRSKAARLSKVRGGGTIAGNP